MSMNKKITWAVVIVVVLIIVINFAVKKDSNIQSNSAPIRIGILNSLTGGAAPWGEYAKKGVDLAVKTINAQGGIHGRLVEVVMEDDHTDGKTALTAYNKLVSIDKVGGVIGGVFDFSARPILPLALANKNPFISPQNFRMPEGLEPNAQSFVMMTDFSTVIRKITDYLKENDVKKLAVVHFTSAWGNEISHTLGSVMKELGYEGVIDEPYAQIGGNDFKTTIIKLKSKGVDTVFLDMFGNDAINFLSRSKELGFSPKIVTYNGALDAFAAEKDKSLLNGVIILNWEINSKAFDDLFIKEYAEAPQKSADKWFDAVYVMANAIGNSPNPANTAYFIENNSVTTPNTTITFTANHIVATTPVEVDVMKDGKLVPYKK